MNRQTIEKGYLDGSRGSGTILRGTGGVDITYHKDGARATILYNATVYGQGWSYVDGGGQLIVPDGTGNGSWHLNTFTFAGQRREDYSYTADGYLAAVHHADSYTDPGSEPLYDWATPETIYYMTPPAWHNLTADYDRDAMGRVIWNKEWGGIAGSSERTGITYDNAGRTLSETTVTYRQDYPGGPHATFTTYITNSYTNGLLTQQYQDAWKNGSDSSAPDSRQTYSYAWWDGALQSAISNDHDDDSGTTAWTTSYSFDASGHIVTAAIADGRPRQVHLAVDQNGMITSRDEELNTAGEDPGPRQLRYHFGGIQIGEAGNNGTDNLEYMASTRDRLTPAPTSPGLFRNGATGPTPFADFEQAYEAINGLSTASTSQSYTVDGGESLGAIAQAMWGDASLWYLIADANGLSGAETLAAGRTLTIPNKVRNNRNSADTWRPYDPNEALGDTSPTDAKPSKKGKCGAFGQILATIVAMAVAMAVRTIPVVGPFIAPYASEAARQGVLIATGDQQRFDWKGMGRVAVEMFNPFKTGDPFIDNAISQKISMKLRLQDKFSWAGVATAGITATVSGAMNASLGPAGNFGDAFARTLAINSATMIASAASSLVTGENFGDTLMAALPSVVGSTVGSMMIDFTELPLGELEEISARAEAATRASDARVIAEMMASAPQSLTGGSTVDEARLLDMMQSLGSALAYAEGGMHPAGEIGYPTLQPAKPRGPSTGGLRHGERPGIVEAKLSEGTLEVADKKFIKKSVKHPELTDAWREWLRNNRTKGDGEVAAELKRLYKKIRHQRGVQGSFPPRIYGQISSRRRGGLQCGGNRHAARDRRVHRRTLDG